MCTRVNRKVNETVNEKNSSEPPNRLSRILALVELLREQPALTREELASRLGITVRQFYTDRDSLAEAGFHFKWDRKRSRHLIESDPFRQSVSISYQEAISLVTAVQVLQGSGEWLLARQARSALEKLINLGTTDEPEVLAVKELFAQATELADPAMESGGVSPQVIEAAAKAMFSRRILEIVYEKPLSEPENRRLQIYSIFPGGQSGGALYADAWCLTRKEYRTFRLSRISDWRIGPNFMPRTDYSYKERHRHVWQAYGVGKPPKLVKLYVSPVIAKQVQEIKRHPSQKTTIRPDGSLDMTLEVSSPSEVLWWSLVWQGHVYVVEPKWLVEEARGIATRLKEAYLD